MSVKLEQLISACPQNLWLELSPEKRSMARQQIHFYSNDVARRIAYINSLCLDAFFGWLQHEPDLQEEAPMPWPNRSELPAIWEFVNGTAIEFGQTRLVLVPSETMDPDQISVPQEWVDIPSWTADYYLAVQANLEEEEECCWMRVWGFATHQTLLQKGERDSLKRAYILDREDLIEDLNVLWVARKICPERKAAAKPLPELSDLRARMLLEELGQPTPYSPRLEKEFEQWAALLENKIWRERLYRRRLKPEQFANAYFLPELPPLSQWFEPGSNSAIEVVRSAGWQRYSEVFNPAEAAALARRLRIAEKEPTVWAKQIDLETQSPEITIALAINLMRNPDGTISILPQVRPVGEVELTSQRLRYRQLCLPKDLQMIVLDESGETFDEVRAGSASNLIQLDSWLSDSPGGRFSVRIVCGQTSIVENFAI